MIYFGTDGIRGIVNEDITQEVALKCGNALGSIKKRAKVLIATDTRQSGDFLFSSFASGLTLAGADIYYLGIAPTPAVSFLVQKHKFDFGVMITASHNPPEDNGIKIFDSTGEKIDIKTQTEIERRFAKQKIVTSLELGKIYHRPRLLNEYINFATESSVKLKGLRVVLDMSNGASTMTAGKIFKKLGADVIKLNNSKNGKLINKNCGALHPQKVSEMVKKTNADVGFAFDGDADRIVMIDNLGNICDGDQILLYLTNMFKRFKRLKTGAVVATIQSNMALELELEKLGMKLIRTDVGDQFVTQELKRHALQLGGEQSGHIILFDYEKTGDGVFCAVQICNFLKLTAEPLNDNLFYDLFGQYTRNIQTEKKYEVINSAKFKVAVAECEKMLDGKGRIVSRASGTENKVRLMVECQDKKLATEILDKLEKIAKE